MRILFIMIFSFCLLFALDESKQLKTLYPLQKSDESEKLLCSMQSDIKTYLYETPLSSYRFFDQQRATLNTQALITWIHGDVHINNLSAEEEPSVHPTLNNEHYTHLGDYRYDIFSLLSDLLLQMQNDSDFSGSKEKAILGTLIDGYFDKIANEQMQCPCIDEALIEIRNSDVLAQYTLLRDNKRILNYRLQELSILSSQESRKIRKSMEPYLKKHGLLPIKGVASDSYGGYLILSEGKSKALDDDLIFSLQAQTLPVSYHFDSQLKKSYLEKTQRSYATVISSFNQNTYAQRLKIGEQTFFVNKLKPHLKLKPQSEKTRAYKNYASALGYMLASFHANEDLKTCRNFSKKAKREVKIRVLKTELIALVYAYNESLEEKWEHFSDKEFSPCQNRGNKQVQFSLNEYALIK